MIDHSSVRRFSTGVPVSATRSSARSARTAFVCLAVLVLTFWASSSTTRPQSTAATDSWSRAAKAHVSGETGARPESSEEVEPRQAALLVGAQRAVELAGRGHRLEPPIGPPPQEVADPALAPDLDHLQPVHGGGEAQPDAKHLAGAHVPVVGLGPPPQESERRLRVARSQLDPPTPDPDERQLQGGHLPQLRLRQALVTDRDLPLVLAEAVQSEPGRSADPLLLLLAPGL